jgi:hypothetical protein
MEGGWILVYNFGRWISISRARTGVGVIGERDPSAGEPTGER